MAVHNKNLAPQPQRTANAAKQAQQADVGGTTIGTSGVTAVPGSITANDSVQPLSGATAAVPTSATPESMRDDVAESSTRARWRMPNWFNVLWSNGKARIGLILLLLFVLVALLAPILAPYDPYDTSFLAAAPPDGEHLLGTTQAGQDVLSQLLWGTRVSLLVGVLAGGLATIIALVIGMTAGYMQG